MSNVLKAIRGMNDLLPDAMPYWHTVERAAQRVVNGAGYREIRTPIIEKTPLFARSIGGDTDIVSKEMYTFLDRNEESLTLRPEGTASCVRAGIEHGLFYNQVQRLWYQGPMFRYERPQKGRYRQFYQLGVEAYGLAGPGIEAELIGLSAQLWLQLGLSDQLTLQLNHLGSASMRADFRQALIDYLTPMQADLDPDSQRRLSTNPLRILDSKDSKTQAILQEAPCLSEYLDADSVAHFDRLLACLDSMGVRYEINRRLVRGLDYYEGVVFEWVTDQLGAQATVCAGGRYDGLVEKLGGREAPAVGFASGLDRLVLLLQAQGELNAKPDLVVLVSDESVLVHAMALIHNLRAALPNRVIVADLGGGKVKNQFKRADKSGAAYALVVGEEEVFTSIYPLKPLRARDEQQNLSIEQCIQYLKKESPDDEPK